MAEIPRLADLREPPVVGRWYMVPFVTGRWHYRDGDWPVMGALHTDVEHFNFAHQHYHIDPRFLTARQVRSTGADRPSRHENDPWAHTFASPIAFTTPGVDRPVLNGKAPHGRPLEKRMRCAREMPAATVFGPQPQVISLQADYGPAPEAIARRDGRQLCPHRKFDLSTIPPEPDGLTICPLHGLRVRCKAVEAA